MNLELLEFAGVREFPKASNKILALMIFRGNSFDSQKNAKNCLEASVFPEPDIPEMTIECGFGMTFMCRLISSALDIQLVRDME